MPKFYLLVLTILILTAALQAQTILGVSPKETSCDSSSAKIMILGTYHMNNPGLDAKNLDADDVLLPRRQKEIVELLEKLARFNPTKITIEAPYSDLDYWKTRYRDYLAGKTKLTRNENDQIGMQLAKRLNLDAIYPIDYPMYMSGFRYDEVGDPNPIKKSTPAPVNNEAGNKTTAAPSLSEEDLLLRKSTVTEFLLHLNEEKRSTENHAGYFRALLPDDNIAIYEKADRLTNWYHRNLRMFANINRITSFPDDRVLVIVGSGHLKILRDFAIDSPQYCLIEPENFLK